MRLTVQLYTVREALNKDLPGTLSELADFGLKYVELAGDYGRSGEEWKALLDERGLTASGAHIGVDALRNDQAKTLDFARAVGLKFVIIPWVGPDAYANGWRAFGESLRDVAEATRGAGLQLAYHNHDFEYKSGDGLSELYNALPDNLLVAEVDAAWVKVADRDPVAVVESLAGRVPLIHGKDFDPQFSPQWRPAGEGIMPLRELVEAGKRAGTEFIAVELDQSPDDDELGAVKKSVEFYHSIGVN